jgi:NAD(P)-dependent dehydrogenase (short-subunit alcohol dehydrogenase family)
MVGFLPMNRSAEHGSIGADEHLKAEPCSALRPGSGAEIAGLGSSWILSSDRAAQVTGQTLNVNGGLVMHW